MGCALPIRIKPRRSLAKPLGTRKPPPHCQQDQFIHLAIRPGQSLDPIGQREQVLYPAHTDTGASDSHLLMRN
jgi:hypothetical protein